jgi:hypothetical protein
MKLRELEKLTANIVVLSGAEIAISISAEEIAPILKDPAVQVLGQPAQQMQLMSLRDQVRVLIGGGSFVFEDQSDAVPPRLRLPDIVQGFIALFASKGLSQFRAYGFNFDVAFDASGDLPAAEMILERFINSEQLHRHGGIMPHGAGLRLYFSKGEASCDLRIEPRENKVDSPRFFSHINYHYDLPDGQFPQADVLKGDFQGKWGIFVDLLERMLLQP